MAKPMSSKNPKRVMFEQFAAVAKAVAHPLRLELLEQLAQGERSVETAAGPHATLGRQRFPAFAADAARWTGQRTAGG